MFLNIEEVATLKIGWRRAIEGFMLILMTGCGAFLFALMNSEQANETMVFVFAAVGFCAGSICIISEIITVTRRRIAQTDQGSGTTSETEIDGCSLWYVAGCLFVTTSYAVLRVTHAITLRPLPNKIGTMILPISLACTFIAIFLRPNDIGIGIKALKLQFLLFAIGDAGASAVAFFREEGYRRLFFAIFRIVFGYPIFYALSLRLRRKSAQLPPVALSKFLCQNVLLGGAKAVASIVFVSFETLSCDARHGLMSDKCQNTMWAGVCLSVYLLAITSVSIGRRAVSMEERDAGLTYEKLTIMRLNKREKVQGALLVAVILAAMYLFSVLGAEGDPNIIILVVGVVGGLALMLAVIMELTALVFKWSRGDKQPAEALVATSSLDGRLSLGDMSDEMSIAGLI